MGALAKIEKAIDLLMSLATLIGFASTAYLVWIFIHVPPSIQYGTENVGAGGISIASENTVYIQGIPFFWILTSLISLSAGHVYRAGKHLVLEAAGKHYFPHAPHLMKAVQPTPRPSAPSIRQTEPSP
jgi:hypothetical protein